MSHEEGNVMFGKMEWVLDMGVSVNTVSVSMLCRMGYDAKTGKVVGEGHRGTNGNFVFDYLPIGPNQGGNGTGQPKTSCSRRTEIGRAVFRLCFSLARQIFSPWSRPSYNMDSAATDNDGQDECRESSQTMQPDMFGPSQFSRTSSQYPQQQQLQNCTPEPRTHTIVGAFGQHKRTLNDETSRYLDDETGNSCRVSRETPANGLQRESGDHGQQGHHPGPNTDTESASKETWVPNKRRRLTNDQLDSKEDILPASNYPQQEQNHIRQPSTHTGAGGFEQEQQTSNDEMDLDDKTWNSSNGAHETPSNDKREKRFYMDSGAIFHSTFNSSVLKLYPAHIMPPASSIGGFGGSTVFVTGYGRIDGPAGKLKDVLLVPDSSANLVSVGQLTGDYPVRVVFYKSKCFVESLKNWEKIGVGHRKGDSNHYVLDSFYPDRLPCVKRKTGSSKKTRGQSIR